CREYSIAIVNLCMVIAGLGILAMVFLTGGAYSEYHPGIILVILAVGTARGCSPWLVAAIGLVLLLGYDAAVFSTTVDRVPVVIAANFFIAGTTLFVAFDAHVFRIDHRRQHDAERALLAKHMELENTHILLKEAQAHL